VSHGRALERVRVFLYAMTLLMFIGTIGELVAVKHYGGTIKLIPFALCVLGILGVVAAQLSERGSVLIAIRAVMAATMAGSLFGVYEHIQGNLATSKEIHRHLATVQRIEQTLQGRDPIAAPGMLAVGALLLIAATYVTTALARPENRLPNTEPMMREPTQLRSSRAG